MKGNDLEKFEKFINYFSSNDIIIILQKHLVPDKENQFDIIPIFL